MIIVSNSAPAPSLMARLASAEWPRDARFVWPGSGANTSPYLPPAWPSVSEAIMWASQKSNDIPAGRLSGETLMWKLAAIVEFACTGAGAYVDHTFDVGELPALFEQIVVELQNLPEPPTTYRELQDEPPFITDKPVRIVVGLSGSGKTSWASEASRQIAAVTSYFDVAETPDAAIPQVITRELAARYAKTGDERGSILAPGMVGLDSLRAMDAMLQNRGEEIVVVLDNVHRSAVETIRSVVTATSKIRWILLAQPGPVAQAVAGLLTITVEVLGGWKLDSIAAEFDDAKLKINPELAKRLRRMTGGLPLFVKHAVTLAAREYQGDVVAMCNQLEAGTHSEQTLQETILSRVWSSQSPAAQHVASLLSLSDVPLTPEEGIEVVATALGKPAPTVAAEVRSLAVAGIVQNVAHRLEMHDSMRIVAAGGIGNLPDGAHEQALKCLKDIIVRSLQKKWNISRQFLLLKLFPLTGDTEQLIGLATTEEEMFIEMGFTAQVRPVLTEAVSDTTVPIRDRFLALDTLVYWDIHQGDVTSVEVLVPKLAELFEKTEKRMDDLARLRIKQMFLAGIHHDADSAIEIFNEACKAASGDTEVLLILRYDLATILFKEGRYDIAEKEASILIQAYYE